MKSRLLAAISLLATLGWGMPSSIAETDLNLDLKIALCDRNWARAEKIVERMQAAAPEQAQELTAYRQQLQVLRRSNANIPNWPADCPAAREQVAKNNAAAREAARARAKAPALRIEKTVLGKKDSESDKISPVRSSTFRQGDVVALLLMNVGKFKQGDDGKHSFDMDMEVLNNRGRVLGAKSNLLGEKGNVFLPNDIAESPYGSIDTSKFKLAAGRYTIKLTIYDRIGGGRATASKSFTIR